MAVWHWLARPRQLFHRVRYWLWERRHPGAPWLCPGTVRWCEAHLRPDMRALEFGSGRSTAWFAARVGHLTSVEHDAAWHERVRAGLPGTVDYRLVPLDHPASDPERADYDPPPAYVRAADDFPDGSLDFVVVDGHYRSHCARRVLRKLRPGGYLLVDDVNLWPTPAAVGVPAGWPVVDDSTNGLKRCIVWQAPFEGDARPTGR
jgi:SAM-dependent methyltransferase